MANTVTIKGQKINVGDRIAVHQKIVEEGKTRIQVFDGLVIGIKGREPGKTFIVRKIASQSVGVERIYPVNSPNIDRVEVKSQGTVRRGKLYYLRGRVGRKAIRVKEKKVTAANAQTSPKSRPTSRKSS